VSDNGAGKRPDHFSDVATAYRAFRPSYPPALIDFLAGLAPARDLAWDAGCGSGQLSTGLAGAFGRVVACDASAAQLRAAAPHPRVDYRVARAEASALPAGTIDLAAAAQAAHWFDLDAYYREVRRVVKPGGAVALVGYGRLSAAGDVGAVIDDFYDTVIAGCWPPERGHVDAGYATFAFPFDEVAPPALEIREEWGLERLCGYVRTWSAVRALERDGRAGAVDDLCRELRAVWGQTTSLRTVRWPLAIRAGHV
jgi:SAM-dependent methyltransferase